MKFKPYSYAKLIQTASACYNDATSREEHAKDSAERHHWYTLTLYFQDLIHRYMLAQRIHGDELMIVRQR